MMNREIVVNGRFLSRRITGVERYGRSILSSVVGSYRLEKTTANGWRGHAWEQFSLPRKLKPESILWSPANSGPLALASQALTVHDLSPLEHPGWFRNSFALWYRLFLPILIRRVGVIFTPSEYVKEKICQRFGADRIVVTPNGVDPSIFNPAARQAKYALPENYILFVGTLEPRKNLAGLLNAWARIRKEFKDTWLIIAGTYGNIFKTLNLLSDLERVCFLGYVEEEHLPGLYAGSALCVLPSLEEGFGLPALEAMACGTPVLVSNGGALPDVVGDAGVIFKLQDVDGLSSALRECLSDNPLRATLMQKGLDRAQSFSWQNTAVVVWKTLHEI